MIERIEQRIQDILATDGLTARALNQALFGPTGLFRQLACSEVERSHVAQSALFQQAQDRLSELEEREAGTFLQDLAKKSPVGKDTTAAALQTDDGTRSHLEHKPV